MPKNVKEEKIETEIIEKRNIAQSISATGVVKTSNTKNVISPLVGLEIKSVNIKEGQKISVGDTICTFDTANLQDNLAKAQNALNTARAQSNLGIQSAQRNLNEAISNKENQNNTTQEDINNAQKAYQDAQKGLDTAKSVLATAKNAQAAKEASYQAEQKNYNAIKVKYDELENKYNSANNSYEAQVAALANAKKEYDKYYDENGVLKPEYQTIGGIDIENALSGYNQAKSNVAASEIELNSAKSNFMNYKSTYENASKNYSQVDSNYQNLVKNVASAQANVAGLEANVTTLKQTYDKMVQAQSQATTATDSTIANLRDNLTNSELTSAISTQSQELQVKQLQEQVNDGTLKSVVNGTVTQVTSKVGDIYNGATIAIIEGCEDFIIEAEVDEYDIPDVKVGMKVLIKTDATRNEELEGRVIYTAPSATSSTSAMPGMTSTTTGGSATYTVKIALDTPNERLRLGMNAKLSIITESKDNVWSVPYDAVYEREDGTHYIEVLKNPETEEKTEINVEKGLEGIYYVEIISNEIKENTYVVLPKIEAGDSLEELIQMMGPSAGL